MAKQYDQDELHARAEEQARRAADKAFEEARKNIDLDPGFISGTLNSLGITDTNKDWKDPQKVRDETYKKEFDRIIAQGTGNVTEEFRPDWVQTASGALDSTAEGVAAGEQVAYDAFGNLVTATQEYADKTKKSLETLAAKDQEYQSWVKAYVARTGASIDQAENAYKREYAAQKERNDAITKNLEDNYTYLKTLAPDSAEYEAQKAKILAMEQGIGQDQASQDLRAMYAGDKATAAELLLKKAQEEAMAQQLSMVSSARGGVNFGALARTASNNIVTQNAKAAQDAAILRAQEQERMLGMMLQNEQAQRAQKMELAKMGMAASAQWQGMQLQHANALQGALGTSAQWQASLADQNAQYANTMNNFVGARNNVAGMQTNAYQAGLQSASVQGDLSNSIYNAYTNTTNAAANIGNMLSSNALALGNMTMGYAGMLQGQGQFDSTQAFNTWQANNAQREADRNRRMQLMMAGMNAGATLLGAAR